MIRYALSETATTTHFLDKNHELGVWRDMYFSQQDEITILETIQPLPMDAG
jgi:hypothetical protein